MAPALHFNAFSSRKPASTSLENAPTAAATGFVHANIGQLLRGGRLEPQ
jgi:hypothetical protein